MVVAVGVLFLPEDGINGMYYGSLGGRESWYWHVARPPTPLLLGSPIRRCSMRGTSLAVSERGCRGEIFPGSGVAEGSFRVGRRDREEKIEQGGGV